MLPQTISTAGEAFDAVADRATAARQSIEGYASFYIKAGNATQDFIKDQEQLMQVVDGAAIALAASGSDATRQKEAFFQLGQAIGSPTVQMEELNTIIDVAPDLFRALGKAIPGANGNLKKLVSTGTVTGKMLAEGLIKILPQFKEQMENMPMSIGTATTLIGNRYQRFIARLNRESSAVPKIAKFFTDGFDVIEKGLDNMVKFFGGATNTIKFFGLALAAALAPFVFKAAAGAIATLLSPIGLLATALLALLVVGEDFYQWMNGGKSVFGKWFGNFDEAMKKLEEFQLVIDIVKIAVASAVGVMVANWIYAATMATIAAGASAAAWIMNLAKFTGAVIANGVAVATWVGGVLVSMATLVAGWVSSFITMTIAALPVILPMLAIIAAVTAVIAAIFFLLDNWKTVFSLLYNIATFNFDGIAKDFMALVDKMKGYWNSVKGFFGFEVTKDSMDKVDMSLNEKQRSRIGALTAGTAFAPTSITPATVAGAAASPAGVPVAGIGNTTTLTVNQTLPPGSPQQTAEAAKAATMQVFDSGAIARQLGQLQ